MSTKFEYLFSPFKIRSVTLQNRLVFLPHATFYAQDGMPTEKIAYYLSERAKGGVGLVIMGGTSIMWNSMASPGQFVASEEKFIPDFKRVVEAVHQDGSKVFLQFRHDGRESNSSLYRLPLWSASGLSDPTVREIPKEMEIEDIEAVIDAFARTATNAREAGFDGVEIYGAHGYLIQQFLSPESNTRTDGYGGSFENRMRFALEVLAAVRNAVGEDYPVGMRINGDDFVEGGLTLDDMKIVAQKLAATDQIDYLSISGATHQNIFMMIATMYLPLGTFRHLAVGVKEVVDLPIICANRINDPVQAETLLAEGAADLIGMCRALIADPELPRKAHQGRIEDIRTCVADNQQCVGKQFDQIPVTCLQNAAAGREKDLGIGTLLPSPVKKRVVVIGGGPGGLESARVAAMRGHDVTLFERNQELGGKVRIAVKDSSRDELWGVVRYLSKQIQKLGVKVVLGTEATSEDVLRENPDAVIVATGSLPQIPSIPGVEQDHVVDAWKILKGEAQAGKEVIVIDGGWGFHQCTSTAAVLADQGCKVLIVAPTAHVGAGLDPTNLTPVYMKLLSLKVEFLPNSTVKEIRGHSVVIANGYTGQELVLDNIDTVVFAWYNCADDKLYFTLKGKVNEIVRVGDCLAPRRIDSAIYEGHLAARAL